MCVCVCVCCITLTYIYIYIYLHIFAYVYVCLYLCLHVYVYVYTHIQSITYSLFHIILSMRNDPNISKHIYVYKEIFHNKINLPQIKVCNNPKRKDHIINAKRPKLGKSNLPICKYRHSHKHLPRNYVRNLYTTGQSCA